MYSTASSRVSDVRYSLPSASKANSAWPASPEGPDHVERRAGGYNWALGRSPQQDPGAEKTPEVESLLFIFIQKRVLKLRL